MRINNIGLEPKEDITSLQLHDENQHTRIGTLLTLEDIEKIHKVLTKITNREVTQRHIHPGSSISNLARKCSHGKEIKQHWPE